MLGLKLNHVCKRGPWCCHRPISQWLCRVIWTPSIKRLTLKYGLCIVPYFRRAISLSYQHTLMCAYLGSQIDKGRPWQGWHSYTWWFHKFRVCLNINEETNMLYMLRNELTEALMKTAVVLTRDILPLRGNVDSQWWIKMSMQALSHLIFGWVTCDLNLEGSPQNVYCLQNSSPI